MKNIISNINDIHEKQSAKIFNLKAEKLVREASDNFIYFRDYETALSQIEEVLALVPFHTKALILKGDILLCMDKDDEALAHFDMAIDTNPFCAEAYGSKAGTLSILGMYQEAYQNCEKAFENITMKERHLLPSLYDQKISILMKMKKFEEARITLNKCAKSLSDEDGRQLISCYQSLISSCCKEKKKKLDKLAKMSLRVVV